MGVTSDPNDPRVGKPAPDSSGMNEAYLVLSEEERAKGFVRPLRTSYLHVPCGSVTTMGRQIAETYARQPTFYTGTYCVGCKTHAKIGADGEFVWVSTDGTVSEEKVGT